ncbi:MULTISPECIES: DNA/RNA nuclease SfsA [unclassified Lentilitoribacter]|jgi:sugar fermentation stimulation protein A|uniref:DNA/RNA nuclease SfsA n=1 Tax=unclassified Lentilitoribacter TaxID=2647570 RepID=UPI0013A6C565|nr:DNA/RNA nuclease SfsA [Lentilitoribacter sp. Alg239-R112]
MEFEPSLVKAKLIRRYKRFLFDAEMENGELITGSCPNTGSMRGLTTPASTIWMCDHGTGGTRKYQYSFELIEADNTIVGINTGRPNKLVEQAIQAGLISDLKEYDTLQREQKYGQNSRIDILLTDPNRKTAYVEVKNVHFMRQPGLAEFPDSKTARGAKHLYELIDMVKLGHRAIMVYLIQRNDCDSLKICHDLDPVYAEAFTEAMEYGVEAYALQCNISPLGIWPESLIKIDEPSVQNQL